MKNYIWAEKKKLRRSKIFWIVLLSIVLTTVVVFAQGQFSYNGIPYIESVEWYLTSVQSLATIYIIPAIVALLGSYIVCREEQEDTMKSLKLIPVNEFKLMISKMIFVFAFSVGIYMILFGISIIVENVLHADEISCDIFVKFIIMYALEGVGVFLATSPIVAAVALAQKGYWLSVIVAAIYSFISLFIKGIARSIYPITSVFQISGYFEASVQEKMVSTATLLICGGIALYILSRVGKDSKCL